MKNEKPLITSLFPDRDSAESAYNTLIERGYTSKDVNVVMSEESQKRHFTPKGPQTELGNKAAQGAGVGGAIGGAVGAIAAAIAAVGTTLTLPGLGLVVAGPLAAALAGAGAGAATGGIAGALVGWNIPEERIKKYDEGIRKGGILIGVHPRNEQDADYLEKAWNSDGTRDIYRSRESEGAH